MMTALSSNACECSSGTDLSFVAAFQLRSISVLMSCIYSEVSTWRSLQQMMFTSADATVPQQASAYCYWHNCSMSFDPQQSCYDMSADLVQHKLTYHNSFVEGHKTCCSCVSGKVREGSDLSDEKTCSTRDLSIYLGVSACTCMTQLIQRYTVLRFGLSFEHLKRGLCLASSCCLNSERAAAAAAKAESGAAANSQLHKEACMTLLVFLGMRRDVVAEAGPHLCTACLLLGREDQ